jgi:hypothetical protein
MGQRKRLAPRDEDRRQKFERLLVQRMNRALDSIRLIGNLASTNYKHSVRDVQLIRSALADSINETLKRFEPGRAIKRRSFSIPYSKEPKIHVANHRSNGSERPDQLEAG